MPAGDRPFLPRATRVHFHVLTADPVTLVELDLTQRKIDMTIGAIPHVKSAKYVDIVKFSALRYFTWVA